ncbi:1907_t:CDS:2, partial [Dentiscutata heterogama]
EHNDENLNLQDNPGSERKASINAFYEHHPTYADYSSASIINFNGLNLQDSNRRSRKYSERLKSLI